MGPSVFAKVFQQSTFRATRKVLQLACDQRRAAETGQGKTFCVAFLVFPTRHLSRGFSFAVSFQGRTCLDGILPRLCRGRLIRCWRGQRFCIHSALSASSFWPRSLDVMLRACAEQHREGRWIALREDSAGPDDEWASARGGVANLPGLLQREHNLPWDAPSIQPNAVSRPE